MNRSPLPLPWPRTIAGSQRTLSHKRHTSIALLLGAFAAVAALGQRTNGAGIAVPGAPPPDVPPIAGKTLETRPQIGVGQQPAFAGQTRAPAVVSQTPFAARVMTTGLNQPWGMAFLPEGKVLVTEKVGTMRVIDMRSGKVEKSVVGLPPVYYGADAGLLDVVLSPGFEQDRLVFFSYVEPRSEPYRGEARGNRNTGQVRDSGVVVAKGKLTSDDERVEDVTTILRVTPSLPQTAHYGCRLLFDKSGFLFVSLGERFFYPTRGEAQSLFSTMGKILRLSPDGKAAPGNPFDRDHEMEDHPLPEIWSYGHRNPQGLAIHPVTGELWESEHGPNGGDEINLIGPGKNYGWPEIAYGTNYDHTKIGGYFAQEDRANTLHAAPIAPTGLTGAAGMEQPLYYWDPTIAPSGMTFYDGRLIPEWKNNLFVAALAGEHISRLVLDGNKVIGEERLLLNQHQRMRDVQEGPDGALWAITDEADGRLIRLAPEGR